MDLTLTNLAALMRYTLQNPRQGARQVIGLDLPMPARWIALAVVALGSAILTHMSFVLMPPEQRAMVAGMIASPMRTAALQGAAMLMIVIVVHVVGRMRGGRGRFDDAVIVVAWLQFILLCLQVAQIVAQVVLPPLGDLIGIVGLGLFFWLLTAFVAELHGFQSMGVVFGGIVLTMIGLAFLMAVVIVALVGGPVAGV